VGGGSDGPPADAASRPFPPGAVFRRGGVCHPSSTPVESVDTRTIPQGSYEVPAAARRPRMNRVSPHGSCRSASRPCSTDESVMSALVSEVPHHDPSMGFDPPRGHSSTRWFPRSPAGPIPPIRAWPKPLRTGVCPRRKSQPSLVADLLGFSTSKNGFDLGSRLNSEERNHPHRSAPGGALDSRLRLHPPR
jgi:hypothetical protein